MGRVYIQNFSGPRTDPCGTPHTRSANSESILSIDTYAFVHDKIIIFQISMFLNLKMQTKVTVIFEKYIT